MDPSTQNQGQPNAVPPQPADIYGAYGPQPAVATGYTDAGQPERQQYSQVPQPNYTPQQYAPVAPQQPYNIPPPTVTAAPTSAVTAPKSNPNSTQNTLQIAEIRDGIVIMNDGSFRSVLMLKSINFDLMSNEEREGVEYGYQGFLNSLYFPVQIFIRSQKVDLRPYLERLDKIRSEHDNMLLAMLMEDYIGYMDTLAQQTNIMDKKFYMIIPYFPVADIQKAYSQSKSFFSGLGGLFNAKEQRVTINEADLAKAKDELRNRVQSVLAGLQQCGVPGLPLDTQELIELYYDTYNPDTATRQQLKDFEDLSALVVKKGVGSAPQPNLNREIQ